MFENDIDYLKNSEAWIRRVSSRFSEDINSHILPKIQLLMNEIKDNSSNLSNATQQICSRGAIETRLFDLMPYLGSLQFLERKEIELIFAISVLH